MYPTHRDLILNNYSDIYRSPTCHYHTWHTLIHTPINELLFPNLPRECDFGYDIPYFRGQIDVFDGWSMIHFTSSNWCIPITVCLCYIMMIAGLKKYMGPRDGGRAPIQAKNYIIAWNLFLSFFRLPVCTIPCRIIFSIQKTVYSLKGFILRYATMERIMETEMLDFLYGSLFIPKSLNL
ncbi:putative transmembrane fatty acid elongation protein [Emiliania huxleyi virus 18]|nr:putative transmembrane fatty acid elongation protein [Emiliania huxleyi virus 18]